MTLEEIRAERARLQEEQARLSLRDSALNNGGRRSIEDIRRERAALEAELQQTGNTLVPRASPGMSVAQSEGLRPNGYREDDGLASNVMSGLTLGLNDELAGVSGAAADLVRGRDPRAGFEREATRARQTQGSFMRDRPNAANLAIGTGAAAPILFSGGAAAAPQTTARGLPLFARQSALGAATGGGIGYAVGAANADGQPMEGRLRAGAESSLPGAALGAVAPAAVNAVAPIARGAANLARRLPTPQPLPNSAGMGGNIRMVPPPQGPSGPRIPATALNTIERLADRSGQSASQLEQRFANIQRNPQGEVLADAFDTPGVQTLRPIAQSPGRTGQRAARTARERIRGAQQRIMTQLTGDKGLNVPETRFAAVQRLENEYRDVSANAYAPMWRTPVSAEGRAIYEQRIAPLLDPQNPNPELRRIMRQAMKKAERQFDLDRAVGRVEGNIDDHLGRYVHYIKMELGELARFEARSPGGASGNRLGALRQLYHQFGDMIDPASGAPAMIPGYRNATAQAGDIFTAERALDEGATWLNMGREEVRARVSQMTPFELYHARVSLADEVRQLTRGRVVGNKNVANALDDPAIQDAIAAAFENPRQAADFIGPPRSPQSGRAQADAFLETVNTQNQLARNALDWGGGSQSWANAMYGADEAAQAMIEAGGSALTGKPGTAIVQAGRSAVNAITGGMVERANNVRGEALLTRIDTPDAESFTRALIAELRRREALRNTNTRISRAGGAAAGTQQGRRK